ncbi:MAG: peptidylprolyl isomerase [Bacteroidota bacterium]
MKRIALIIALLTIALQGIAQDRAVIDQIIGKVGNELVLLSDVEQQYELIKDQQQGPLPDDIRCSIMENLMSQNLLLNQAKLDSILVTDEEVELQLDARIENILAYMNNDVQQFQDYYGQTVNEVREQFRIDLKNQLLIQRMRQDIITGITITPAEVKTFFNSIPVDSLPYFNSEVEVGEIVYKPQVNEEEREKARQKLVELRKRIVEGGEDFAEIASRYSQDPGSARAGGDLGRQKRGTFVPEFEAAAYNLNEGEISELVETEFGFHVIQLKERRGNLIDTRHILIKPEITKDDLVLAQETLDSIRQLVVNDSISFSLAVKRFSDENQQSFNNDGNMINPKTGNTFFEIGDLDPDVYFTIDTMQVDEVSNPFGFYAPTGETYFRVVILKSRTVPHKASLELDYSKIKEAALESKRSEFISSWVAEKVNSTYSWLATSFDGCPILDEWNKGRARP